MIELLLAVKYARDFGETEIFTIGERHSIVGCSDHFTLRDLGPRILASLHGLHNTTFQAVAAKGFDADGLAIAFGKARLFLAWAGASNGGDLANPS